MAKAARHPASPRPPAVAIHDDGNMQGTVALPELRRGVDHGSDLHDVLFLGRQGIVDRLDVPVGQRLNLVLVEPPVVLADVAVLLHLLQGSEEHTSELQSLMRISYAVFCLKKKTKLL